MKPAKYPDNEIIAAGEELKAEGKDVSPNAIKLKLGGGNPSRIKKVWEAHQATEPQESRLKKPADPDEDKFAWQVTLPIQNAASKVEGVFERLLDDISERAERRLEDLLGREEARHRNAEAELEGQLKSTQREVERKEKERYDTLMQLMRAEKKIESLELSIKSMQKQINQLKEKENP